MVLKPMAWLLNDPRVWKLMGVCWLLSFKNSPLEPVMRELKVWQRWNALPPKLDVLTKGLWHRMSEKNKDTARAYDEQACCP